MPFNGLSSLIGPMISDELRISGSISGLIENVLVSNCNNHFPVIILWLELAGNWKVNVGYTDGSYKKGETPLQVRTRFY